MQRFDMRPDDAQYLKSVNGPVYLTLKGKKDIKIGPLYVLGTYPGENPFIRRVELADRRIWWTHKHIRRYFNCRRNFSFKRLAIPDAPLEVMTVDPNATYARWSLKNKTKGAPLSIAKWKVKDVLDDVVSAILEVEQHKFGLKASLFIGATLEGLQIDIENLFIDDSGDRAIERILNYIPSAGIYVSFDGDVVLFNRLSGEDETMLEMAGPKIVGDGDARLVTNERLRPEYCDSLFTYEPELRFDFQEPDPTRPYGVNERYMENVLPIPDWQLDVTDTDTGKKRTMPQGTWITFKEALDAWGPPPRFTSFGLTEIQKCIVPFMDLWAGVELAGNFNPNADWSARIAAINEHYRKTFRINRNWMDRIWKLKAYRVATLNPERGTRSPAVAYADYSILNSQRALFAEAQSGTASKDLSYMINVRGFPSDNNGILKQGITQVVPGKVEILDEDQGIIHVDFLVDPFRLHEAVLPGMVVSSDKDGQLDSEGFPVVGNGPSGNVKDFKRPVSFDAVSSIGIKAIPKVTQNWRMAIIFTAIPGAPNDERGLYRVRIKATDPDLKKLLPAHAHEGLSNAQGPPMEIRIGPGVETARVAWSDLPPAPFLIGNIFGVLSDFEDLDLSDLAESDQPIPVNFLVINDDKTLPSTKAASLRQIALAAAAQTYAVYADRVQGEMAATLNPKVKPAGWLAQVTFTVGRDGRVITKMVFAERVQPFNLFAYMDASTRAVVMHLADPYD